MPAEKVSISLSPRSLRFVEKYRARRHCSSRSAVLEEAIELLRKQELEIAYRAAATESPQGWDNALSDGLTHETW